MSGHGHIGHGHNNAGILLDQADNENDFFQNASHQNEL